MARRSQSQLYPEDQMTSDFMSGVPFGADPARPMPYIDVSNMAPAEQFVWLNQMLERDDQANPAPYTGTPPWGEGSVEPELNPIILEEQYLPPADLRAAAEADLVEDIEDAPDLGIPAPEWWNDDQVYGLGVPPGYFNDQPIEYGGTQAVPINPASEHGWDAWSGRTPLARVAQMQNSFPLYGRATFRGLGQRPAEKYVQPYAWRTQQARDMLLIELRRRGVHYRVVRDVPSVPFTDQVLEVDPLALAPEEPIGPEGVMPW